VTWSAIAWAGFVAGVLAACAFWLFRSFGLTLFSPTTQLGCLFSSEPGLPVTETVGVLVYLALAATVVPAAYAGVMGGRADWDAGVVLGAVHGAAAAALLPWWGRVSRCVRAGRLPPPGVLGTGWGPGTPVLLVAGHMVYGGVLGAVLAGF
jgi:hypothetical protein